MATITKGEFARELKISADTLRRELKHLRIDTGKRKILWPSEQRAIRNGLDARYTPAA